MTASLEETPSVTSGLKVSVQAAKPVLPIRFLYEELPNVYVFPAHKVFTTFCAFFLIEYLILSSWLCLWSICALFIFDTTPRKPCVFRCLEVGNIFLILSYSKAKGQTCLSCGAISNGEFVFF